jgi:hypothetical protein
MKTIRFLQLLLGSILMLSTQCTKEKDYRDSYVGDYNFIITGHYYNLADSIFYDTTFYFSGYIAKTDNNPSCITICYKNTSCMVANLSQDGSIDKPQGTGHGYGFNGKFERTDKVSFTYYNWYPIPNVTTTESVTGDRK